MWNTSSEHSGRQKVTCNDRSFGMDAQPTEILSIWGPMTIDLFATRMTTQLPHFISWRSDLCAEATNAFTQQWGPGLAYANP